MKTLIPPLCLLIEVHLRSWPEHQIVLRLDHTDASGGHFERHWPAVEPSVEMPPHPGMPPVSRLHFDLGAAVRGHLEATFPAASDARAVRALEGLVTLLRLEGQRLSEQHNLEQARARLEATLDAAPLALYALTLEGLVQHWNRRAEQTFGYSRSEVLGRPAPEPLRSHFAALRHSLTRPAPGAPPGEPSELIVEHTRPDGAALTLRLSAEPLEGAELPGTVVGSAQSQNAIEAQHSALEQQRALLESVLAYANDSVLITEAEPIQAPGPRILYANAAFTRTTGYTQEEILGKTPRLLQGPRSDRKVLARIRAALERWEPIEIELVNYRKDGSEFWVELSIAPVADAHGWYTHWISIQRDITERKRLSEHLDQARAQVLERAAQGLALEQVLSPLLGSLERQFRGAQAALALEGQPALYRAQDTSGWPVDWDAARLGGLPDPEALGGLHRLQTEGGGLWLHAVCSSQGQRLGVLALYTPHTEEPQAEERAHLETATSLVALVLERREAQRTLEHQALFDALTGLPNRTAFERSLQQRLEHPSPTGRVVVGLMDLDRFKQVNDTLGHGAGDALLEQVARRLRDALEPGDLLARMGGDEFLLLSERPQGPEEAQALGAQLLSALAHPFWVSSQEMFVQASLGMSLSTPGETRPEQLLQQADTAMYQAKRRGGGTSVYHPEFTPSLPSVNLESALHRALERREFVLHYQPLLHPSSGQLLSLEALLRWQHPQRGLLSPGEFIPLAEVTGLIVPIGGWVLREACLEAARHTARFPALRMAVNLSARQLGGPELIRDLETALSVSGLDPARLELELTESLLMQVSGANHALKALKRLGVRLILDDFGTGYSSLAYLRNFPIDGLKLDRSFVRDIGSSGAEAHRGEALVRAIVALAHALSLEVTVEGVERDAQLSWLRTVGCHQLQGYALGRPMPSATLERWLEPHLPPADTPAAKPPLTPLSGAPEPWNPPGD